MKYENELSDLIEKFGVPKIIIPNQKIRLSQGNNPIRDQFKYGETDFLTVKSRTETWVSNENKLIDYLKGQNLEMKSFIFTKTDWLRIIGQELGKKRK